MILYFADRHLNILGQATSHLPKGVRLIYDLKSEDVESGVSVFEGDIGFDRKTRAKVEKWAEVGNYILKNSDSESELYNIIDATVDTKKQKVSVYAEDDGLDLINDIAEAYEADQEYPISSYVERFAGGAGWEIGINEVEGLTRKLSWDSEQTVSARLRSIAEAFNNCELSFSFKIKGLKISKKYINIYEKRGKDTGVQLRLNKGIDSIVTTKSIANLATALKPRGSTPNNADSPITLLGYEYDDGDFYVDGAVLKSRKALQKWSRFLWKGDDSQQSGGHIVKSFNYDTTSQAVLCEKTIEELKKVCDMEINYEVDIKKLPDNVKIGDRVNIIDDAGELYLSTRILKLESSESDREYKATLGEHLIKGSGISQKVADLAAQFAANTQSAQKALEVANAAKENADKAKEEAEKAAQDATQAQEKAEEAKQAADSATESANQAAGKADAATEAVDKVEESVSELQQTIDNANQAAQNAHQAAQDATAKAEEAEQAAANAQAKAEEAATANSEAQAKAEEAITKANTATETANTAKSTAQAASDTAAAAKADAEQAQSDIAKWESELETVVDTMESDYTRKTEFTETTASLQSQITRNAGEISSTIKSVETIDETANNAKQLADSASETAAQAKEQANSASATAAAAQQAANTANQAAQAAQSEADTAKAAAEAAQGIADKAEADLEAAKADLATVAGRVDATEADIIAAQTKVNEAQAAADKAKEDAQAAADKATTAQNTANTAVENAAAAQAKADKAATDAAAAQQKAEEAKGNAATAQAKADEAAATAAEAQEIANTAKSNADSAQATANQAAADAATAQQKADTAAANAAQAQTDLNAAKQNLANVTSRVDATEEEVAAAQAAVEVAQAAADKAKADAATAQTAADKAKSDAAAAQTAANNAKTAADNAQAAADAAQEAADKAQEDVNALAIRVTKTETDIVQTKESITLLATKKEVTETLSGYYTKSETTAQIQAKANSITSTVAATYATKTSVSELSTQVTQTDSKISWLVKSGTSAANFTITDRLASLTANYINLNGLVSFSGLNSSVQTTINNAGNNASTALSTANSANSTANAANSTANSTATKLASWASKNDSTYIDGGKIYTSSITADKLNVTSLSAICAKIGGFTIGDNSLSVETGGLAEIKVNYIAYSNLNEIGYVRLGSKTSEYEKPFEIYGYDPVIGKYSTVTIDERGIIINDLYITSSGISTGQDILSIGVNASSADINACSRISFVRETDIGMSTTPAGNIYLGANKSIYVHTASGYTKDEEIQLIGYNEQMELGDTTGGTILVNNSMILPNNKFIYSKTTAGVQTQLIGLSGSDNLVLGVHENNTVKNAHIYVGERVRMYQGADRTKLFDLTSSQVQIVPVSTNTTSSGSYVKVGSTGILYKETSSSKRYKHSISQTLSEALSPEKLYDLPVVEYVYNDNHLPQSDKRYSQKFIGLIAEDVDKIYPLAADYNDEGLVENWNIRILVPGMLKLIQNQHQADEALAFRLDSTDEQILSLKAQLADTTTKLALLQKEIDILKSV